MAKPRKSKGVRALDRMAMKGVKGGIIAVLNLAAGLYASVAYAGEQRATGLTAAVFSAIVLWLLYGTEKDREFFAS